MVHIRKWTGFLLVLCLALGMVPRRVLAVTAEEETVSDYTWITEREAVDGADFTGDPALVQKLNDIFDGKASVYYDAGFTKMVNTELGSLSLPNNGVNRYVGPCPDGVTNVGTSCWIYANGVYYTLFGEATGLGAAGENSEKLDLSETENRNFTLENFVTWGVRPGVGALIRTQCGHSLVVLGYDEERLTILDGNGNGRGLIAIRDMTWERVGFRAKYIIQPKQDHMDNLYPEDYSDMEPLREAVEKIKTEA